MKIGDKVRIVKGAWSGNTGQVIGFIKENGGIRVRIDGNPPQLQLAFFPSELENKGTFPLSSPPSSEVEN